MNKKIISALFATLFAIAVNAQDSANATIVNEIVVLEAPIIALEVASAPEQEVAAVEKTGFLPSPIETFSDTVKDMRITRDGKVYNLFGTKVNDGVVKYQIATIYKRDMNSRIDSSATQDVALVVVNVKEMHDGSKDVLYRTYQESAFAKEAKGIAEHSTGQAKRLAATKRGEIYINEDGELVEKPFGISDLLSFQITGFGVVLCVLAGMWLFMTLISWGLNKSGLAKSAPAKNASAAVKTSAPAPAAAQTAKTIHPGMSDEKFIAILSAAATHALGGQAVSVVKFKPLSNMDWTWAIQGRVQSQSKI